MPSIWIYFGRLGGGGRFQGAQWHHEERNWNECEERRRRTHDADTEPMYTEGWRDDGRVLWIERDCGHRADPGPGPSPHEYNGLRSGDARDGRTARTQAMGLLYTHTPPRYPHPQYASQAVRLPIPACSLVDLP